MAVDGFQPEDAHKLASYNPRVASAVFKLIQTTARAMGVQVEGIHNLPKGRALLVANHAFGWDLVFVVSQIWQECDRKVWVLGEHVWWKVPFMRRIALALGVVDGTREAAKRLLQDEQLVLVLPGGLREALKPRELRYRLLWGHRYGFVKAAILSQAPIVPVASIGADDLFDLVGNAFGRGRRLLRRPGIPIPLPARILPIPHWERLRFVIGEPIPPGRPECAADKRYVRRLRREVEGALHEIIDVELARRIGFDV
jgi:1-acyl-sn-glycerol-3-phosphate acyltransferase